MSRASYGRRPAKHGKYRPNARGFSVAARRRVALRKFWRWATISIRLAVQMFGLPPIQGGKVR